MTSITVQNGQIVLRDGAIGTEQACCCKKCEGPCDEENPCPEGCLCVDGECAQVCVVGEVACPEGFVCCQQLIEITQENVAVYEFACFDLFAGPIGKCCYNFGNNCVETTRGDCFCSFDGLRGVEVFWTEGLCVDGCSNPLP